MDNAELEYIKRDNPLFKADLNDVDWLELNDIKLENLPNPLIESFGLDKDPAEEVVEYFLDSDYLGFAARILLNLELPPYQCVVLNTLWKKRAPMLLASRGRGQKFFTWCLLLFKISVGTWM